MRRVPVCHIVCAGPGELPPFAMGEGDLLIAADGGYAACLEAGLQPAVVIGDFDSLEGGAPLGTSCDVVTLPRAKDDTDFMVCVQEALTRGFKDIRGYKILGGDLGHTVGGIKVLSWLREQGAAGALHGCGQTALVIRPKDGEVHLSRWHHGDLAVGTRVSVFALGGDASGICERDLAWELEAAVMSATDHFGVSNEVAGDDPAISVGNGSLLVVIG